MKSLKLATNPQAGVALLFLILLCAARTAWCDPTLTSIYHFGLNDGAVPAAGLVEGSNGSSFGTTQSGGVNGSGTVFSIDDIGDETTIYSFSALDVNLANPDGANPAANLVLGPSSTLFGTTQYGGSNGTGTIFKITNGGVLTTLYTFSTLGSSFTNSDGANPASGLIYGQDGNFYGATQSGGTKGNGTLFKMTPAGKFTTLYTFSVFDANLNNTDGAIPSGLVQTKNQSLFGTTQLGGVNGEGTIFQITTTGTFTTLYSLGTGATDGFNVMAGLVVGVDGNLYGTTENGGVNGYGTVFQITPAGTFTTLYSFGASSTDGVGPTASLVSAADGKLYGATSAGGANGNGTLFSITTKGVYSLLYSFSALDGNFANNDGATPSSLYQNSTGNLYGTNMSGGANGAGGIFLFTITPLLTAFYPTSGVVGAQITLYGSNFTGTKSVQIGKLKAVFTVVSDTQMTVTIPSKAISSQIMVKTPNGSVTSVLSFTVIP